MSYSAYAASSCCSHRCWSGIDHHHPSHLPANSFPSLRKNLFHFYFRFHLALGSVWDNALCFTSACFGMDGELNGGKQAVFGVSEQVSKERG